MVRGGEGGEIGGQERGVAVGMDAGWTDGTLDARDSAQGDAGDGAVREATEWSQILEVRGDALVNWRGNKYKLYRQRGLGFMRVKEVAAGLHGRVLMPMQRPPVTVDKMVEGPKASVELTREMVKLSSWELSFTPEAIKRLERFKETNVAD